jgi:hypothetical protein
MCNVMACASPFAEVIGLCVCGCSCLFGLFFNHDCSNKIWKLKGVQGKVSDENTCG